MKIEKSTVTIKDIEIFAYHGVFEHERKEGGQFRVSVSLDFDAEGAMMYDDLALTVNYAEVVQIVHDTMLIPSNLIENVTYRISQALIQAFPTVLGGTVAVTKVNPPYDAKTGGATFTLSFSTKS